MLYKEQPTNEWTGASEGGLPWVSLGLILVAKELSWAYVNISMATSLYNKFLYNEHDFGV